MVSTFTTVANGTENEGRIASITHLGFTNGAAADRTYSYGYNDAGRVETFSSAVGTRTYAYDSFHQVIGATGGTQSTEAYAYDKNGNRIGSGVVVGTNNRLLNDGTYSYVYDAEGNRIRRTVLSGAEAGQYEAYTYDYRQRLVQVQKKASACVLKKVSGTLRQQKLQ